MLYTCPVCGYPSMTEPPTDYYICPSCGTEFGNDDTVFTYDELRTVWLEKGPVWFSRATEPPPDWNPYAQLFRAGLGYEQVGAVSLGYSTSSVLSEGATVNIRSKIVAVGDYVTGLTGRVQHTHA